MKNILLIVTSLCLLLCSCLRNEIDLTTDHPTASVSLQVQPDQITEITRTTDDAAIRDVNLFLYFPSGELALHLYSNTSQLRFNSPVGTLTLAVAANIGVDMGKLSLDELERFTLAHQDDYPCLPMTYRGQIDIHLSAATVELPPVILTRSVARIEYNIMLAPQLASYTLAGLQLINMPRVAPVFDTSIPPSADSKDYITRATQPLSGRTASGVLYLFPNLQGLKSGITDQRQKNLENAPENATFLRIAAMKRDGTIIHCNVFLGENNTSDFNVRANTSYAMNMNILGDNLVDTRISKYAYYVMDDFMDSNYYGAYCLAGERHIAVRFSTDSRRYSFKGHFSALVPTEDVIFNGVEDADVIIPYVNPSGEYSYPVDYRPGVFTTKNSEFKYTLSIADEYDFTRQFPASYKFTNGLKIYYQKDLGRISTTGGIGIYDLRRELPGSIALCWEAGCTVTAIPNDSYIFEGWYSDAACTKLVSAAANLKYMPTQPLAAIYPKFSTQSVAIYTEIDTVQLACNKPYTIDSARKAFIVPKGSECILSKKYAAYISGWYDSYDVDTRQWLGFSTPYSFVATEDRTIAPEHCIENRLDEAETANCYIFYPEIYGLYSFDATIRGNGKSTKNITPKPITGAVKVVELWYMDIFSPIAEVAYRDGRIYFMNSSNRQSSNSIIGLLDTNGNILWSWHLWRTPDPSKSAVTFPDGRTLMDRNLGSSGARSNGQEALVSGFGFYYQWGRKDPFPYPNRYSETQPSKQAHYTNGYELTQANTSPAATIDWAAAHPTTFINGTDTWKDWLPVHNLNLWGNPATAISNTGGKSSKTIYDPCPPGWKVPDEATWAADAFYINNFSGIGYMYLATSNVNLYYYPVGGYFLNGSYINVSTTANYWTDSPARSGATTPYKMDEGCAMIVTKDKTMTKKYGGLRRDAGAMVRCMKDE